MLQSVTHRRAPRLGVTARHRTRLAPVTVELDALRTVWQRGPVAQRPPWPDAAALAQVTAELATLPPLVVPDECDRLRALLRDVARGQAFLLQGGDCAETFAAATAESV